eukprot:CAMPEP_0197532548 /NCGR_PEP_ID=MMETSP1318-20131121/40094_1 /TAXON_ID=552666 /ORGANISM="Partenskyella glossopodia, Strain RCC365" /LENGTH=318 /DNA_ID=CAMNT_0043089137 /DNA_START=83 /DNA_END=1040 /DNA_ORIENTATION=+
MSGVGTTNPFALLGDPSDSKPSTKKVEKGGRGSGKASDKGSKGGRGTRGPKRQFDRQSGTGRGKEVHKKGHGKGGWGKFGEEYGTPADDGTRPPRGRGRRGRRGGRKGRGRKGRGGRGANKDATPAADGETPADGEAKETKEGEEAGDKDFEDVEFEGGDEEEEIEDPDNFTLEEYMQGLKVVGGTKKARSVDASDGFKAGKVVPGKKSAAEETEEKFQGSKKKKKKGKKKLNLGIFNETVKPPGVLVDRNVKEDGVEGAAVEAEAVVALVAALVAVAVAVATVEVAAEAGAEACRVLQGSQTNSQSWLNSDMVTINT